MKLHPLAVLLSLATPLWCDSSFSNPPDETHDHGDLLPFQAEVLHRQEKLSLEQQSIEALSSTCERIETESERDSCLVEVKTRLDATVTEALAIGATWVEGIREIESQCASLPHNAEADQELKLNCYAIVQDIWWHDGGNYVPAGTNHFLELVRIFRAVLAFAPQESSILSDLTWIQFSIEADTLGVEADRLTAEGTAITDENRPDFSDAILGFFSEFEPQNEGRFAFYFEFTDILRTVVAHKSYGRPATKEKYFRVLKIAHEKAKSAFPRFVEETKPSEEALTTLKFQMGALERFIENPRYSRFETTAPPSGPSATTEAPIL